MNPLPKMFLERNNRLASIRTEFKNNTSIKEQFDIMCDNAATDALLLTHFACIHCGEKIVHRDECPNLQVANFEFAN